MRSAAVFVIAWFIAGPSSAQTPAPSLPSVMLPAPLARVLTDYETAWQRKDAAALAALFTEDGFVLSSGTPPVRGRAQIEKHYTGQGGPLALRALAFATEGSLGYIIGGFARAKDEPDTGKFTLTLRKAGSRWMIMSDMDNGNARRQAADGEPAGRVVFVCEHGSVKSVMAAHWFNRLAAERKAPFRAISRGVAPDDAIPPAVAHNLGRDGFDVAGFTPQRLEKADLVGAVQVVAIGIDSPLFAETKEVPVARWSDIPPASTDYTASRDAMRARMGALLDSLSP